MSGVRINAVAEKTLGVRFERGGRIGAAVQRGAELLRTLRNGRAAFALNQRFFNADLRQIDHHESGLVGA
jgi:hypothetical protein